MKVLGHLLPYTIFCIFIIFKNSTCDPFSYEVGSNQITERTISDMPLRLESTLKIDMEKGQKKRYYFQLDRPNPLRITISGCLAFLSPTLLYNETINLFYVKNMSGPTITIPCAPIGRYDLILVSKSLCQLTLIVSLKNPSSNWTLIDQFEPSNITYQNRIQKKQMIMKWDKSKLDYHAIEYCVVINTQKNYQYLCSAITSALLSTAKVKRSRSTLTGNYFLKSSKKTIKIRNDRVTVACTGKRNKQILKGLQHGKEYFVDIFGIHTLQNNLTFNLKSTSIWFNRSQPIELQDGRIIVTKLSELGRQTVFHFKVRKTPFTRILKLQILPCSTKVSVKVFKQKVLQDVQELYRPSIIYLNSSANDRYTIKIAMANKYERSSRQIGVIATTAQRFPNLPELPLNRTIYKISSASTCRSTWIAWHSSPDPRDIQYCIVLMKLGHKNVYFENPFSSNICDTTVPITQHPHFTQIRCVPRQRVEIEKYELTNLSPDTFYAINVLVQLEKNNLFYDMIRVVTNKYCLDSMATNESTIMDDPHIKIV